jgi:hypothetical protein
VCRRGAARAASRQLRHLSRHALRCFKICCCGSSPRALHAT